MEKKVKSQKKAVTKDFLIKHFIQHVLETGTEPVSVFAFTKSLKCTEKEFYGFFNSFKALQKSIWAGWFEETISSMENEEAYQNYSVREKLLSFYFSWIELLKDNKSFVQIKLEKLEKADMNPDFLGQLKEHHTMYISDLMTEGKDTEEVMERPFSDRYHKGFWVLFLMIMKFWSQDESEGYEKTDAFIEKSVNLAFDLVARGPLDSMMDFAKFMLQNRM